MPSLNKYTGPWTDWHAAHLLRRTTYGVKYETIKQYGSRTLDETVDTLLTQLNPPPPPVNISYADDPDVPIGQTWVDKPAAQGVNGYRNASLRGWSLDLMANGAPNIREKMTMFWHNHFVTADINDPRLTYKYIELLRSYSLGNFKQLTKDITIDPAMLNYLNGRDNTKQAPNENYARELLELFTLGKGELAGPGDYTTYTEQDIKEIAKVLTGWVDVRLTLPIRSQFQTNRHDTTTKQLSHRFGNATINNAGAEEYKNLINIIFQKPEVAHFIARKLYVWFVKSEIDTAIESDIIGPLANIMSSSDYEILPAVRALISSDHFYEECVRGAMIKNPVDFLINPINQFSAVFPDDLVLKYRILGAIYQTTFAMQMGMYQAPSVAGWQAYYQAPNYYRLWLNSTSLPSRKLYTDAMASAGLPFGTYRFKLDTLNAVNKFPNPADPENVLDEMSMILFCKPVAANQRTQLRTFLVQTGGAVSWANVYNAYKADPTSETKKTQVTNRLWPLVVYMMRMPEYHLS